MSRNQQIIILVLAVLFSVGLVAGAYIKKRTGNDGGKPAITATETPVKPVAKPQPVKPVAGKNAPLQKTPKRQQMDLTKSNNIYKPNPVVAESAAVRMVVGQMRGLSVAITGAILRGKMGYEHLEQLDFTPENGVPGGSDYAVFNQTGAVRFRPVMGKWIDQDLLDQVTSTPGQAIWYSLRRQQDPDAFTDVLYAIIPYPSASLCSGTRLHFKLNANLSLANDNGQVVPDRAGFIPKESTKNVPSCLFTPDNKSYWVFPLRSRLQRPGAKTWQAAP